MDVKRRTEVLDHVIHHLLDLFLGSLGPFSTMETTSSSQPIRPIRTFENTVVPWHVVHMRVTASFPLSSGNGGPGAFISASLIRIRKAPVEGRALAVTRGCTRLWVVCAAGNENAISASAVCSAVPAIMRKRLLPRGDHDILLYPPSLRYGMGAPGAAATI